MTERIEHEAGWVLHHRPYRETSLLLEVFSREHGRIGLVANGARRPKSRLRATLQPFQPLLFSWSQRGELGTLRQAELQGAMPGLSGDALYAGFYLNELLMRLCLRGDPHPELFDSYCQAVKALAVNDEPGSLLRLFERDLLEAIGYGLQLELEAASGQAIQAGKQYLYDIEHGPRLLLEEASSDSSVQGETLIALRCGALDNARLRSQAKRILQTALKPLLEDKPLRSVQTLRQLRAPQPAKRSQEAP